MFIRYISYGISKTGGFRHESILFQACVSHYKRLGSTIGESVRKNKLFDTFPLYLQLMGWAFFKSNADINIVPARCGIPAMMRNLFNNKEVWTVLHNFDDNDGKSTLMAWYYKRLFSLLRHSKHKRFKLICVSDYWKQFFMEKMSISNTYVFPNLFDHSIYRKYRVAGKNPWVHLGQFSKKNDPEIMQLAQRLTGDGYYCYFSTLVPEEARPFNGKFDIIFFVNFDTYLDQVSRSFCTLALTVINEGWNRVAHESILLETPVIGYNKGGLGDLLKASNSIVVKDIEEAYTCIRESLLVLPESSFADRFGIEKAGDFLDAICKA